MPNISRGFEAPNLTLQPTEIGVESTAAAARRIPAAYNQVADATAAVGNRFARELGPGIALAGQVAEQHIAHQEISHGQLAATSKFAELTDQWNKITSDPNLDPNDTTIAQKFRDEVVEPQLEKLRDGFLTEHGQRWAESKVDSLRNHLWEKTAADMSTLAGVAVRNNVHQMANATSVTAMKDPSSVPFLLASIDSDVTALVSSSPNLKGADSAKVRETLRQDMAEKIVKAGAQGAIMSSGNPEKVAIEWAEKYPKYINGEELKQLGRMAAAQNRANLLTQKQLETYQKQQQQQQAQTALSKTWTDSVTFDDSGKATIKPTFFKDVMKIEQQYPGAATEHAKTMINWAQAQQRERREIINTDPSVKADLMTRMFDPNKPLSDADILGAAANEKLSAHDTTVLLNLNKELTESPLKGPIYQGTMAAVKGVLGDSEKGQENYAKFLQVFIPEYLKQMRDGKLPPNALDLKDDKSLISTTLKPWRLDPREKMLGHIMKNLGVGVDPTTIDPTRILNPDAKPSPVVPLPPKDQLEAGKVYDTPRGRMKWTGTGFVAP